MIKLVSILSKYRSVIFLFLAFPIFSLWKMKFEIAPDSEFKHFKITVTVPHTQAEEIVTRVTEPAEKILNGIEGLLSLESHSKDQGVDFKLIFHRDVDLQDAYLYIQEKIDRLKIIWPRNVEQINVDHVQAENAPDLVVQMNQDLPYEKAKELFTEYRNAIDRTEPDLNKNLKIVISPNLELMLKEKISLPQVEQALRAKGFIVSLGQKNGTIFEINHGSIDLPNLESLLIGSRGHRPLRLAQIADIYISTPEPIHTLNMWLDNSKTEQINNMIEASASIGKIARPKLEQQRKIIFNSISILIAIWIIQIVFSRFIFKNWNLASVLIVFQLLLSTHFIFWCSVLHQKINVFDFQALWLSNIIFGFLLLCFFARVKTFFLPSHKVKKTTHSMEQVSLISLMELWPTFTILLLLLYFIWGVFFESHINPIISLTLNSFFFCGLPSGLFLLLFLPMHLTQLRPSKSEKILQYEISWNLKRSTSTSLAYLTIVMCILGVFAFFKYPLSVKTGDTPELNIVRGYGAGLFYLQKEDADDLKYKNEKELYQIHNFSNVGLSKISNTNIAEFQQSLKNIKSGARVGLLNSESDHAFPIHLEANLIESIGGLILQDRQGRSLLLSHLTDAKLEYLDSSIYRNRLQSFNFVEKGKTNLLEKTNLTSSQWTSYILSQFKEYHFSYIAAFVYCVLFLALYINSFIRPLIILGFSASAIGIVPLSTILLKTNFHVDSIAFISLIGWFVISLILIVSRICDTERTRGHDRDDVVEDVRLQFLPAFMTNAVCFCFSIFAVSLLSQQLQPNYFSFWHEAWIAAVALFCNLLFCYSVCNSLILLRR